MAVTESKDKIFEDQEVRDGDELLITVLLKNVVRTQWRYAMEVKCQVIYNSRWKKNIYNLYTFHSQAAEPGKARILPGADTNPPNSSMSASGWNPSNYSNKTVRERLTSGVGRGLRTTTCTTVGETNR